MPILSIVSLLFRILQGVLWVGGLIGGARILGGGLGAGEAALLGGGGAAGGNTLYQKLFGNMPKGGYATGAAEMEGLTTAQRGLLANPVWSKLLIGAGLVTGIMSLVQPVGGDEKDYSWRPSGPAYGIDENGNIIQTGMISGNKSSPLENSLMSALDVDPTNQKQFNDYLQSITGYNPNSTFMNYPQNMSPDSLAQPASAFNNNLTFDGFQQESGLDNVTFKQENHFEINVQGSLDDKSTPDLFKGIAGLLAGRWS